MVFDPVDQVGKQSKLKVRCPVHLFLFQVPLAAQAEILAVKPLSGLHHRDAMIGVILLRNGNIHTAAFVPSGVLHQLLDLAFEIAGDAFSYTHLDVYKRQWSAWVIFALPGGFSRSPALR